MMTVQSVIEQREILSKTIHPEYDLGVKEIGMIRDKSTGIGDMIINSFYCGYFRGREAALCELKGSS